MTTRNYLTLLMVVSGLLMLLTLAHFAYIVYAYQHCSIIEFIAGELW